MDKVDDGSKTVEKLRKLPPKEGNNDDVLFKMVVAIIKESTWLHKIIFVIALLVLSYCGVAYYGVQKEREAVTAAALAKAEAAAMEAEVQAEVKKAKLEKQQDCSRLRERIGDLEFELNKSSAGLYRSQTVLEGEATIDKLRLAKKMLDDPRHSSTLATEVEFYKNALNDTSEEYKKSCS